MRRQCQMLLYLCISLEKGFFDHGKASLGGLVLNDSDLSVDGVTVLPQGFEFGLDVGKDLLAVG